VTNVLGCGPTDATFSADDSWMYIVNGKSDTGPNPGYGFDNMDNITFTTVDPPESNADESAELKSSNQYQFRLEHEDRVPTELYNKILLGRSQGKTCSRHQHSSPKIHADGDGK